MHCRCNENTFSFLVRTLEYDVVNTGTFGFVEKEIFAPGRYDLKIRYGQKSVYGIRMDAAGEDHVIGFKSIQCRFDLITAGRIGIFVFTDRRDFRVQEDITAVSYKNFGLRKTQLPGIYDAGGRRIKCSDRLF